MIRAIEKNSFHVEFFFVFLLLCSSARSIHDTSTSSRRIFADRHHLSKSWKWVNKNKFQVSLLVSNPHDSLDYR